MKFEWDETKAAANLAKHGVSFALGTRVFLDPARRTTTDARYTTEHRENTTGLVDGQAILTVCHTDRTGTTRIISARKASRPERKTYHAHH